MTSAGLLTIVFVVAGFARNTGAIPPPLFPTTTTTTTTTTQALSVRTEPVRHCRCCARYACTERINDVYLPYLENSDFAGLTDRLDMLCGVDLPIAEECLWRTRHRHFCGRPILVAHFKSFCAVESEMKEGRDCWASGFQGVMQNCLKNLSPRRRNPCQGVEDLKLCLQLGMARIPQCSYGREIMLVVEYVRNFTLPHCPNQ